MEGRIVFIHGLTPIHTGTGQSVDVIDLPVAREKATNWPYIPGSSIKGVLRDAYECLGTNAITDLFGPEKVDDTNAAAGQLVFADAKLLCLPVRSFYGTFCWTTCPSALARYRRDCECAGFAAPFGSWTTELKYGQAVTCSESSVSCEGRIYLEDLDVNVVPNVNADDWASAIGSPLFEDQTEQDSFKRRFAVVSDDLFTTLAETATEVVARIRIDDDTKTVQRGRLWYEEAVPAESVFWFPLLAAPRNGSKSSDLLSMVENNWVQTAQIGGNATVGRGIVRLVLGREA